MMRFISHKVSAASKGRWATMMTIGLRELMWRLQKRLTRKAIYALSAVLYVAVIGSSIAPRFYYDFSNAPKINASDEVRAVVETCINDSTRSSNGKIGSAPTATATFSCTRNATVPINSVLMADTLVTVDIIDSTARVSTKVHAFVRLDSLILYTGIWFVLTFACSILVRAKPLNKSSYSEGFTV